VSAGDGNEPWVPPQASSFPWGAQPGGGQYPGPPAPPGPPGAGPRGTRLAIITVIAVVVLLGGVAVVALWAGSGSHTKASVASPWTTTSVAGTHRPASALALANMGVQPGDLGVNWTDDGIQPYSADLANPPPDCAPYANAFTTRDAGAVHQYSFDANGEFENGGLSSTVIENPSAASVAAVLPAVRGRAFATCAEATAQAWLTNHDGQVTVLQVHAAPIDLVTGAHIAGWRATVDYTAAAGRATFGMDIFYISSHRYLAKVRVALCPCQPQPGASLALLPDETEAVTAVSQRVAGNAVTGTPGTGIPVPAPAGNIALSDPCQLLTPARVNAIVGGTRPPARTTTGDDTNECSWIGTTGKSIVIQAGDSMTQFETRLRDSPQPLTGLGDQAAVDPEYAGKVLVRKGNIWIWVFVGGTANDRLSAVNLARSLLPKL
jgi:hypothetical protein